MSGTRKDGGAGIEITAIEVLALKKLALVSGALAQILTDHNAAREQRTLTRVLIDVVNRAELANALERQP